MVDIEVDKDQSLDDLVKIAVDRLEAVAAGEEPKNVSASGGSSADSVGDDSDSSVGEELPLDGGTYTWDNGVTMKLSVSGLSRGAILMTPAVTGPAVLRTRTTRGS